MMKRMLGIGVTLLMASAALVAHGHTVPVPALMAASLAATARHWQARHHYTYMERDASRHRDTDGRVTSEDVEISRTILVDDVPFEQLVERNGQPPSARDASKQNAALDKLHRETPQQRTARVREQDEETASLVREVPKAFDFQLAGEEVVRGRPAYVLRATPRPGYEARGKYGRLFAKVQGTLWIDTQDLVWIKVDGQVIQPFSVGLILLRLSAGSRVAMDQTRADDGTWLPMRVEVRAAARILLLKSLVIDRVLTYSDYQRSDAMARAGG